MCVQSLTAPQLGQLTFGTASVHREPSPTACMLPLVLTLHTLGIRIPTLSCPPSEEAEV